MRNNFLICHFWASIFALANPVTSEFGAVANNFEEKKAQKQSVVYQQPHGCPESCECDDNLSSTVCSRRNLTAIPPVPVTSLYAYFDRNPFVNPRLSPHNFTSIPYVRGLYLRGCGIVQFEVGTFRELKFLRELDLSYNKISFIPRGSFANLQLEFLDLGYNPAIRLMPDSFCGAAILRLSLKCCDLEHISVQTFHPLFDSITSLTLSCNDLETIPAALVWGPSHMATLNIAENPRLVCDCNMVWITRRQNLQKQVFKVDFTPKGCTSDSQIGLNGDVGSNCSTDAVMLKDIDYGLCVRSLEAIKMSAAIVFTTSPLSTYSSFVSKKPKKTGSKTTTIATTKLLSTTAEMSKNQTSTANVYEYSLGDDSVIVETFEPPPLPQHPETTTSIVAKTKVVTVLAAVDNRRNITSKKSKNGSFTAGLTVVKLEPSPSIGGKVEPPNPALQYTRAHMFAAVLASATFTFISASLCFCAHRICAGWVGEHRRKMDAKQRGDITGVTWGKSCSICSSGHDNNTTTLTTRQMLPGEVSLLESSDVIGNKYAASAVNHQITVPNNSKFNINHPSQQHCVNGTTLMMRPSVSYPNNDLMKHSTVSVCTPQSSPLGIIVGNKGVNANSAATNKQTLHVRMAFAK